MQRVRRLDAFDMRYIRDMEDHCSRGIEVPKGDLKETFFNRKLALLRSVNELLGLPEFERAREKFTEHVLAFAAHNGLKMPPIDPPVSEKDIPQV